MEGGRKPVTSSSSSSISSDLFGSNKSSSSSSSAGIFDSVFPPPSSIRGSSGYSRNDVVGSRRKQDSEYQAWNPKHETQGDSSKNSENGSHGTTNKGRGSIFQDERTEPCYLSSSLYYGGQDVYSSNPSTRGNTGSSHMYKKDSDADDPNASNLDSASRGNWWQGSLYY